MFRAFPVENYTAVVDTEVEMWGETKCCIYVYAESATIKQLTNRNAVHLSAPKGGWKPLKAVINHLHPFRVEVRGEVKFG